MRCCSFFIRALVFVSAVLLAGATATAAGSPEATPGEYAALQSAAAEQLEISVGTVLVVAQQEKEKAGDADAGAPAGQAHGQMQVRYTIKAMASVERVLSSASGLEVGDTIAVEYVTFNPPAGNAAGVPSSSPPPPPILKQGNVYPAFLRRLPADAAAASPGSTDTSAASASPVYTIAAGGYSFRYAAQPAEKLAQMQSVAPEHLVVHVEAVHTSLPEALNSAVSRYALPLWVLVMVTLMGVLLLGKFRGRMLLVVFLALIIAWDWSIRYFGVTGPAGPGDTAPAAADMFSVHVPGEGAHAVVRADVVVKEIFRTESRLTPDSRIRIQYLTIPQPTGPAAALVEGRNYIVWLKKLPHSATTYAPAAAERSLEEARKP